MTVHVFNLKNKVIKSILPQQEQFKVPFPDQQQSLPKDLGNRYFSMAFNWDGALPARA